MDYTHPGWFVFYALVLVLVIATVFLFRGRQGRRALVEDDRSRARPS